jgi:hypothetical protein
MEQTEQLQKLQQAIASLEAQTFKIFILTQDTKGVQRASVSTNYRLVKVLTELGYDACILHEKKDYQGVSEWLGEGYSQLPHACIEEGNLQVGAQDLVIIPEVFGHVLEQTKDMPCARAVLCQSYDYIFETLQPGQSWQLFNVNKCITTSDESMNYIKGIFPGIDVSTFRLSIPDYFKADDKPKKPIIAIHTRDPRDTAKIVKTFYIKYPQYRWVTFRDMRGLNREDFAQALGESCLSVWIDDISGLGTFPLESMKCGTPVIGKIPNMKPGWMQEKNGFWTYELNQVVDITSSYFKNWLEDSIPQELYDEMSTTHTQYSEENETGDIKNFIEEYANLRKKGLVENLDKFTQPQNA